MVRTIAKLNSNCQVGALAQIEVEDYQLPTSF